MKRLFGSRLKKRFLGLAGLLVIGLAVHFLDQQRPVAFELFSGLELSGLEQTAAAEPDYYTLNSRYYAYNAHGVLDHSISARQLLHFSGQPAEGNRGREATLLTEPELVRYDEQGNPFWQARAQTGRLINNGDHFQLNQNVIVWKPDPVVNDEHVQQRSFSLFTDALTFNIPADSVQTEHPVRILTDAGETQSVGLYADLNSNVLRLKQVRSTLKALPAVNN